MDKNKIILFTLLLVVLFISTSSSVLSLTGKGISRKDLVGVPLKGWLENNGVSSDFESLIDAAQNHSDSNARWRAVQVLSIYFGHKSEKVFQIVVENDPKAIVKETAALALVKLGRKEYLEVIKKAMEQSEYLDTRIVHARDLAEYGDPSGYAHVIEGLDHSEVFMRLEALSALPLFFNYNVSSLTPNIDPMDKFAELGKDPSPNVRSRFVFAVGNSGKFKERFKEVIKRMQKDDPDKRVRERANLILVYWSSKK
jgi:HEAT repeat protein